MQDFRLMFDRRIPELERSNRWQTVIDIVLKQWNDCPKDINRLLCAGTQLWYTILVMDEYRNAPTPPSNFELVPCLQLQEHLMSVTRFGFKHFSVSSIFNAYFGYMISVRPYCFIDYNGDYVGWQEKGESMVRYSYALEPDNLLAKAMCFELEGYEKNTQFFEVCHEIWSQSTPELWGDSAVQQYFFRILHGEAFYPGAFGNET